MKKRFLMMAVALALAAGSAFALPEFKMSAGIGGLLGGDFGGGYEGSALGGSMSMKTPYFGGGGFAFFDATYAELSLGILAGGGNATMTSTGSPDEKYKTSVTDLTIGLLGKFPFAVGEKLLVFPALGMEYDVCLKAKAENPVTGEMEDMIDSNNEKVPTSDFSAMWIKFGGGLDFAFTDNIFLRFEALYGIRLANKWEKDMKSDLNAQYAAYGASAKTRTGHGITAKLAVGYKFLRACLVTAPSMAPKAIGIHAILAEPPSQKRRGVWRLRHLTQLCNNTAPAAKLQGEPQVRPALSKHQSSPS